MRCAPPDSARFHGIAMPIVLLMLMAALLLGMTAARLVQIDAQAARNGWDREIAFQAAEAALLDGERDIAGASDWPGARAELFHAGQLHSDASAVFVPGCGRGRALGLCQAPAWRSQVDALARRGQGRANQQAEDDGLGGWVPYGSFSGQRMPQGGAGLPARLPRYIVEALPDRAPGAAADAGGLRVVYRITALGFGTRESTRVVLQSLYRKPEQAPLRLAGADHEALGAISTLAPGSAAPPVADTEADAEPNTGPACAIPPFMQSSMEALRVDVTGADGVRRRLLITAAADGTAGIVARNADRPDQVVFAFDTRHDPAVLPLREPLSSARWRVGGSAQNPQVRQFLVVPGAGHLFLLALDQAPGQAWVAGRNYYKLGLPAAFSGGNPALSAPALAPGNDGAIRHAYFGDAGGRLWRLDFDEGWPQRLPPTSPLFAAADGHGQAQAIPLRPALAFAAHGYLVLFGASGAAGDSFYAIHDHQRSSEVLTRAQLAPRLLREVVAGQGARHVLGTAFQYGLDAGAVRGWYLDLPVPERIAASPWIRDGVVGFRTWTPAPERCDAGVTRSYLLESLSGLQLAGQEATRNQPVMSLPLPAGTQARAQGIAGDKMFQPVQQWDSTDPPDEGTEQMQRTEAAEQAAGTGGGVDKARGLPSGRLGWREIIIE